MIHSLGVDTPEMRPLARRDRVVGPRRGASGEKQNIEFLYKPALARVLLIPACLMKSPHTSASGRVNWTRRSGGVQAHVATNTPLRNKRPETLVRIE